MSRSAFVRPLRSTQLATKGCRGFCPLRKAARSSSWPFSPAVKFRIRGTKTPLLLVCIYVVVLKYKEVDLYLYLFIYRLVSGSVT